MRQVRSRGALRARAMNPALLGASHARRAPPRHPAAAGSGCSRRPPPPVQERQAGSGRGDFWGAEPGHGQSSGLSVPGEGPGHWPGAACKAEKRRAGVGARQRASSSDSSQCLSAVSAANEASFATRPRTEHRSAVGAKRRPPQHEPLPEPACRDALTSPKSGHPATSAMGRLRSSGRMDPSSSRNQFLCRHPQRSRTARPSSFDHDDPFVGPRAGRAQATRKPLCSERAPVRTPAAAPTATQAVRPGGRSPHRPPPRSPVRRGCSRS
jgi:hypothetical protein